MSQSSVAVIDYGMGNLHSVASALQKVGADVEVRVTADPQQILSADRVVFPGVGAIRDCMAELERAGLIDVVREAATTKPFLGICVGMQALMNHSEENGGVDCLGILPGAVKFFGEPLQSTAGERLKVPHMGWSQVHQCVEHPLWDGIEQDSRFYFVHSYFVHAEESALVAAEAEYGVTIHAALHRNNLFAVQFHPEKSGDNGLRLLGNFLRWQGE